MIPRRAEEMSNKQHVQKKNLKVSKNVLRKEVDKLRDNWINAGPGVPGVDPEVALDRLRFAKDHLAQCVRCFADSHGCPPGARRRVGMRLPACTHCRRSTCAVGRSHQRCHARPTMRLLCRLHSRTHITDARALSFVQICPV